MHTEIIKTKRWSARTRTTDLVKRVPTTLFKRQELKALIRVIIVHPPERVGMKLPTLLHKTIFIMLGQENFLMQPKEFKIRIKFKNT